MDVKKRYLNRFIGISLLLVITLVLTNCEALKTSRPIVSIKEYERMIVGRLDAEYVGTQNCLSACHYHDTIKRSLDASTMGLQLSRKSGLPLVNNSLLREVSLLTRAQAKTGRVEIIEEYGEIPKMIGDPNQLKQVFVNIINNAIHAMPEGGKLHIITSSLNDTISVIFSDTGEGIPDDVLPRIFEPFFTTKREKGTGLGLSISYRIIQDHGGRIDVESEEGKGTTFSIRLPVVNPAFKEKFDHIKTG